MFTPPPMDKSPADGSRPPTNFPAFSDFPPTMSPPPMDDFSPDKEFSPPPMDDFSPSKEFSPPPFGDFASNGYDGDGLDDNLYDLDDYEGTIDLGESDSKFDKILQIQPREILELKKESEQSSNFLQEQISNGFHESQSSKAATSSSKEVKKQPEHSSSPLETVDTSRKVKEVEDNPMHDTHEQTKNVDNQCEKECVSIGNASANDSEKESVDPVPDNSDKLLNKLTLADSDPSNGTVDCDIKPDAEAFEQPKESEDANRDIGSQASGQTESELTRSATVGKSNIDIGSSFADEASLSEDPSAVGDSGSPPSNRNISPLQMVNEELDWNTPVPAAIAIPKEDSQADITEEANVDFRSASNAHLRMNEKTKPEENAGDDEDFFADFEAAAPANDSWDDKTTAANDSWRYAAAAGWGEAETNVEEDEWGNFEDTTKVEEQGGSDDEFGDFGGVESPVQQVSLLHSRIEKINAALEKQLSSIFEHSASGASSTDNEPALPPSILASLVEEDTAVWSQVDDPARTPALEFTWTSSALNSSLLNTLGIDTRSMLHGENWKRSIPRNQHKHLQPQEATTADQPGGGILQPTILQPVSVGPPPSASAAIQSESPTPPGSQSDNLAASVSGEDWDQSLTPSPKLSPESERHLPPNFNTSKSRIEQLDQSKHRFSQLDQSEQRTEQLGQDHYGQSQKSKGEIDRAPNKPSELGLSTNETSSWLEKADLHSPDFDWSLPAEPSNTDYSSPALAPSLLTSSGLPSAALSGGALSTPVSLGGGALAANNSTTAAMTGGSLAGAAAGPAAVASSGGLSSAATAALNAFPLLDFMKSPVLMQPTSLRFPLPGKR